MQAELSRQAWQPGAQGADVRCMLRFNIYSVLFEVLTHFIKSPDLPVNKEAGGIIMSLYF